MKRYQRRFSKSHNGAVNLLRICTVLLAVVSFWATAQGMKNYVFSEEWQAYAASLAVQGILLGLNFYLPTFLHQTRQRGKSAFFKNGSEDEQDSELETPAVGSSRVGAFIVRFILLCLTLVVLFCSSWFSFIYITGRVYEQSWDTDSQLLIQSTYRQQLYNASDYANSYIDELRDTLSEQVLSLYAQSLTLESSGSSSVQAIDWAEERNKYTDDSFAAADSMVIVINAMETATGDDATENDIATAEETISTIEDFLEDGIKNLNSQIATLQSTIDSLDAQLQTANSQLNRASSEADITDLVARVNYLSGLLNSNQEDLGSLQSQLLDYQGAEQRIQFYETVLNQISIQTDNQVWALLRNIQQELFAQDPDIDLLEEQAQSVFDELQAAMDISENNGVGYQSLLTTTYDFIQDLQNYQSLRTSVSYFNGMLDALKDNTSTLLSDTDWKTTWAQRLDELKAQISDLPVYAGAEEGFLADYDRAEAADSLDEMIRLYLSDHNAAQQSLIYLFSPYSALAWFSAVLALFLDIVAFITGVLIYIVDQHEDQPSEDANVLPWAGGYPQISMKNHYLYLTGDYVYEYGKNVYRAIENERIVEVELKDSGLTAGLYCEQSGRSTAIQKQQSLAFISSTNNVQDGVYLNCSLDYKGRALMISIDNNKTYKYLTSVDEDTPVYQFIKGACMPMIAQNLKQTFGKIVVLALNQEGGIVSAIYILKD